MRVGRGETSLGELPPGNCRLSDAQPLKGKASTDPRPVCAPFCLLRALPAARGKPATCDNTELQSVRPEGGPV